MNCVYASCIQANGANDTHINVSAIRCLHGQRYEAVVVVVVVALYAFGEEIEISFNVCHNIKNELND